MGRNPSLTGARSTALDLNKVVRQLVDQGFQQLAEGDPHGALETGQTLIALQHAGGYELLALAYDGLGETDKALEILEEGVAQAPGVWALWNMLGSHYSETGHYPEAEFAFRQALECDEAPEELTFLNLAILAARQDQRAEAFAWLGRTDPSATDDPGFPCLYWSVRAGLYAEAEDPEAALACADRALAADCDAVPPEHRIQARVLHARALHGLGEPAHKCRGLVLDALHEHGWSPHAAADIRQYDDERDADAPMRDLLVQGTLPDDEATPFYRRYGVRAGTDDEALDYVRATLPQEIGDTLDLVESVEGTPVDSELKGVYSAGPWFCYAEEEDEEDWGEPQGPPPNN